MALSVGVDDRDRRLRIECPYRLRGDDGQVGLSYDSVSPRTYRSREEALLTVTTAGQVVWNKIEYTLVDARPF